MISNIVVQVIAQQKSNPRNKGTIQDFMQQWIVSATGTAQEHSQDKPAQMLWAPKNVSKGMCV